MNAAPTPPVPPEEIARRVSFAEAVLGSAGHEVADPVVNNLVRQVAAEEISGDEAVARALRHLDGL